MNMNTWIRLLSFICSNTAKMTEKNILMNKTFTVKSLKAAIIIW